MMACTVNRDTYQSLDFLLLFIDVLLLFFSFYSFFVIANGCGLVIENLNRFH